MNIYHQQDIDALVHFLKTTATKLDLTVTSVFMLSVHHPDMDSYFERRHYMIHGTPT